MEQMTLWTQLDPPSARIHSLKVVHQFSRWRYNCTGCATRGRRMSSWLPRTAETYTACRFLWVVSEQQRALLSRIVRVRSEVGALDPPIRSQRSLALQVLVNRSPARVGECACPSTSPGLLLVLFLRIRCERISRNTMNLSQGLETSSTVKGRRIVGISGSNYRFR